MNTLANNAAANIQKNQAVISGLEDSKDDAPADLADTYATTEKQVENSANQIVMGAQTQYISLCTMQDNIEALDRTIAAIDRQLPVVEKQYEIEMCIRDSVGAGRQLYRNRTARPGPCPAAAGSGRSRVRQPQPAATKCCRGFLIFCEKGNNPIG